MKAETSAWIKTFLAGFLATVLGIFLTLGIESRISASKRAKTARLLAEQIVDKMDRTYQSLMEYQELYDTIDSTSMCLHLAILADTLDRVDSSIVELFINSSLSEYVQADVDSGVEAYKSEILTNIGSVDLLGHIDEFYALARQYSAVSSQVVDQKRVVSDVVYAYFYGKLDATLLDYVRFLHELPEFNVYYSRMQNVRLSLDQIGQTMKSELDACKLILEK